MSETLRPAPPPIDIDTQPNPKQDQFVLLQREPVTVFLVNQGVQQDVIAGFLGRSPRTVAHIISQLRREGQLPETSKSKARRRTSEEVDALKTAIITGIQGGETHEALAEKLGIPRLRVTQLVADLRSLGRLPKREENETSLVALQKELTDKNREIRTLRKKLRREKKVTHRLREQIAKDDPETPQVVFSRKDA